MSDFDGRSHVNRLLAELGYVLGELGLELDEDDRCVLGAGDAFAIDLFFNWPRGRCSRSPSSGSSTSATGCHSSPSCSAPTSTGAAPKEPR